MDDKYRLVFVRWLDICATAGWEPADEVEPIEVLSVGWLFSSDGVTVKVGSTLGDDGDPYGITAIPQGCVVSIIDVCPESPVTCREEPPAPSSLLPKDSTTPLRRVSPLNFD